LPFIGNLNRLRIKSHNARKKNSEAEFALKSLDRANELQHIKRRGAVTSRKTEAKSKVSDLELLTFGPFLMLYFVSCEQLVKKFERAQCAGVQKCWAGMEFKRFRNLTCDPGSKNKPGC
jgi:hypothetical protein